MDPTSPEAIAIITDGLHQIRTFTMRMKQFAGMLMLLKTHRSALDRLRSAGAGEVERLLNELAESLKSGGDFTAHPASDEGVAAAASELAIGIMTMLDEDLHPHPL